MNKLQRDIKKMMSEKENQKYIEFGIIGLLILYTVFYAPELSEYYTQWFSNIYFQMFLYSLIALISFKSPTIAIISVIAIIATMETARRYDTNKKLMLVVQADTSNNYGKKMDDFDNDSVVAYDEDDESIVEQEQSFNFSNADGVSENMMESVPAGVSEDYMTDVIQMEYVPEEMNYKDQYYPQYAKLDKEAQKKKYGYGQVRGYDATSPFDNDNVNEGRTL